MSTRRAPCSRRSCSMATTSARATATQGSFTFGIYDVHNASPFPDYALVGALANGGDATTCLDGLCPRGNTSNSMETVNDGVFFMNHGGAKLTLNSFDAAFLGPRACRSARAPRPSWPSRPTVPTAPTPSAIFPLPARPPATPRSPRTSADATIHRQHRHADLGRHHEHLRLRLLLRQRHGAAASARPTRASSRSTTSVIYRRARARRPGC